MRCPKCGHANPAEAKFCAECGHALASPRPAAAERRQLTVMFCDLVGSTELSARLDPEELRDLIREHQTQCAEVVARFDGTIVQYLGDGVLVYFGVPHAHEDDACRAGYAGLEIVRAVDAMSARWAPKLGAGLAVRVGIHTGSVVVGEVGAGERTERLAIGETPNIAARLQSGAAPNSVVVSEATYRLVSRHFHCRDLGNLTFSGVPKPVHVFALIGKHDAAFRGGHAPEAAAVLVGRRQELATLLESWHQARSGNRQVVLLRGEAGIGKSRLVATLADHAEADGGIVLEGHCSPYYQNSAFYAVAQLLARWLGFVSTDAPLDRQRKLESALGALRLADATARPLLASLLAVPFDAGDPAFKLGAALQRERTLDALLAIPQSLARQRPVMLVVEDLHWVDPSTLEFLNRCVDRQEASGVLLVLTSRPEFDAPWREKAGVSVLNLAGLDAARAEELVTRATGGKALPPDIVRQIVQRADGVPLFIEETTRAIIESGVSDLVPMSLQDALMARLDRLGPAKSVVQLGATIGRDFSYELLRAVSTDDDSVLQPQLERAVASGLLQPLGTGGYDTFVFKHSLVQETAYQSLLRKTRQLHHERIADALENRFQETVDQRPELVAHHHTEAGNIAKALPYWQKAGNQAIARAAFAEAINHLSTGLRLLKTLTAGAARDRQELALQSSLGMALQAHRGYAAAEVDRAYARARDLCHRSDDRTQLISVLRGQHLFYGVRADYGTAMQISREMLELAQRDAGPGQLMEAHLALGLYSLYLGDFVSSRQHLESGIALYEPNGSAFASFHHLGHSVAMCHSYLARTLWFMGYTEDATRHSLVGLDLARTLALPMTVAQTMGMHTLLFQVKRDVQAALDWARQTRTYAAEHGFPYWASLSSIVEAWGIAEQGDLEQGMAQYRRALENYLATGARLGLSWFLALLAQMLARSGQIDDAFEALTEAAAHEDATGERYYECEVHRLRGELMARGDSNRNAGAEGCFQEALAAARRQHARAWELRAATSLARLWYDEGRSADARALLDAVCATFPEREGDADLRDARRLLDELVSAA